MALIKAAFILFFVAYLTSHVSYSAEASEKYLGAAAPMYDAPVANAPMSSTRGDYCLDRCEDRCKTHPSRKRFCQKICTRCCISCKCVPPGPIGTNADKCKNWTATVYQGLPYICP
ncbi:hypothetical protein LINPERPRIM_LOCUS32284 [Linum perenne]